MAQRIPQQKVLMNTFVSIASVALCISSQMSRAPAGSHPEVSSLRAKESTPAVVWCVIKSLLSPEVELKVDNRARFMSETDMPCHRECRRRKRTRLRKAPDSGSPST